MNANTSLRGLLAAASALALVTLAGVALSHADVTIEQKTAFDGIGPHHWFAADSENTIVVSGDKMRQDSTAHATGSIMKHFAKKGMKSATITRLDRKVMYLIDFKDESYEEWPFTRFADMQQAFSDASRQAQAEQASQPEQKEEPKFKCDPVKLDAKRTGEKETVGGFDAERVKITGDQTCTDLESKKTCRIVYAFDTWNAPATGGLKELQDFYVRQAKAMGMSIDASQAKTMADAARALASVHTEGFESVVKELHKVGGYSVKSHITISTGGDCGGNGGAQDDSDSEHGPGEMFKGLFHRKKKDEKEADSGAQKGLTQVFGVSTEIVSVKKAGAPADAFEPPAGFKKKEPPAPPKS